MSHEEKNTWAQLASTALVTGAYLLYVNQLLGAGVFAAPDGLAVLGRTVLIVMVGGGIVVNIFAAILVNIVFAIATGDAHPNMATDERDRMIELRSFRVAALGLGVGFVLSMVALALGQSAFVVLNLIIVTGALANVLSSIVKLVEYRRGF